MRYFGMWSILGRRGLIANSARIHKPTVTHDICKDKNDRKFKKTRGLVFFDPEFRLSSGGLIKRNEGRVCQFVQTRDKAARTLNLR